MPKPSRRKAQKARIEAAQLEAAAKEAAAEAERVRLEEERAAAERKAEEGRLEAERQRKRVIPEAACALLGHCEYAGGTKIDLVEWEALAERSERARERIAFSGNEKDGGIVLSEYSDALTALIRCSVNNGMQGTKGDILNLYFAENPGAAAAMPFVASWCITQWSQDLCFVAKGFSDLSDTISAGSDARLKLGSINFLLRAAETGHLESLLVENAVPSVDPENAWAVYHAIVTSHPLIVAAYISYREKLVEALILSPSIGMSERSVAQMALDSFFVVLGLLAGTFVPILGHSDDPDSSRALQEESRAFSLTDQLRSATREVRMPGPKPNGLVCTNADPYTCASCNSASTYTAVGFVDVERLNFCCGTMVCPKCSDVCVMVCSFCRQFRAPLWALVGNGYGCLDRLVEHVEEGYPWAQNALARLRYMAIGDAKEETSEEIISISYMLSLFESAAGQGCHEALALLSTIYTFHEDIVPCDESKARGLILSAYALEPRLMFDVACDVVCELAYRLVDDNPAYVDEARDMMGVFLSGASGHAFDQLANMLPVKWEMEIAACIKRALICYVFEGDVERFEQLGADTMNIDISHGNAPLLKFVYSLLRKTDNFDIDDGYFSAARKTLVDCRRLCAECGVKLSTATRKMCSNCKAICYCSRSCQKMHWNRTKCFDTSAHRNDCLEVSRLRSFAVQASAIIERRKIGYR